MSKWVQLSVIACHASLFFIVGRTQLPFCRFLLWSEKWSPSLHSQMLYFVFLFILWCIYASFHLYWVFFFFVSSCCVFFWADLAAPSCDMMFAHFFVHKPNELRTRRWLESSAFSLISFWCILKAATGTLLLIAFQMTIRQAVSAPQSAFTIIKKIQLKDSKYLTFLICQDVPDTFAR